MSHIGEMFALATAFSWALSVILFKKLGTDLSPVALNLFKNVVGSVLLLITLYFWENTFLSFDRATLILLVSGVAGIAIADTLLFRALNLVGASWTAAIECFYAPSVILFAFIFLNERLTSLQFLGGTLIVSSLMVPMVMVKDLLLPRQQLLRGLFFGLTAMLLMAASITWVKPILENLPVLYTASYRMLGGTLSLLVYALFQQRDVWHQWSYALKRRPATLIGSGVLGAYLSLIFWMAGFKYTSASVASLLNQCSTLFIFAMAILILKEPLTRPKVFSMILALTGCILTLL